MEAKKDNIIEEAEDLEQCLNMMDNMLMEFAQEFAANEKLIDDIPEQEIEDLKNQLEPSFIHAYVTLKNFLAATNSKLSSVMFFLENFQQICPLKF